MTIVSALPPLVAFVSALVVLFAKHPDAKQLALG